jgi:hypothetical protein
VIQRQRVQETPEEKLSAIEYESGNAEVQWNNIKENMLDTISDLVGKVEKTARKPWVTQEMISKMDERRNELKRATDKAKKKILRTYVMRLQNFKERDVMIFGVR